MPEDKLTGLSKDQSQHVSVNGSRSHIAYLDGLRALAAIFVVIHHCVLQYFNDWDIGSLPHYQRLFILFFMEGHYAVSFFYRDLRLLPDDALN